MQFKFQDTTYTFPDSLSQIKLSDRIAFYNLHGKFLDDLAKKVQEMKDVDEKEAEAYEWNLHSIARHVSFYSGIPLECIMSEMDITDLQSMFFAAWANLNEQEQVVNIRGSYDWNGCKWVIASPVVSPTSRFTLGEFIYAKEVVRNMEQVANGKWASLPFLCAIFLRKEGEAFDELFCEEGSERLQLMQDLPMDIAIEVGFFLSSSMTICTSISHYLDQKESREDYPLESTLSDGGGLHS
jgi:hypothetical protein